MKNEREMLTPHRAGNMYSSPSDTSALGRAILRPTLLSPTLTRRWLKPLSWSSEPNAGVGSPWGVRRIVLPITNGKRVIDSFNKAGRIGYCSSLLVLLPDYGVGFTILIAGPNIPGNTNFNLADLIGGQIVPALEAAAREQAGIKYGGEYIVDEEGKNYLKLTTQEDRPGLGVDTWASNRTDMKLISVVLSAGYEGVQPSVRLYPTGLETIKGGRRRVGYKAVMEDLNIPARVGSMFSTDCGTWVSFTSVTYGTHALDQWVFELEGDEVVGVQIVALRVFLKKVS